MRLPLDTKSSKGLRKVAQKILKEFVLVDLPDEAKAHAKRGINIAIFTRDACGKIRKLRIGQVGHKLKAAPAQFMEIPGKFRFAVKGLITQLEEDLSALPPDQRSLYLIRLASYTASALGGAYLGNSAPDQDIALLGIGKHRNALFHSALSAMTIRLAIRFLERAVRELLSSGYIDGGEMAQTAQTCFQISRFGVSLGVGTHLMVDGSWQGSKAVLFGDEMGSLIDKTLVDDRAWLLLNGFVSSLAQTENIPAPKARRLKKYQARPSRLRPESLLPSH